MPSNTNLTIYPPSIYKASPGRLVGHPGLQPSKTKQQMSVPNSQSLLMTTICTHVSGWPMTEMSFSNSRYSHANPPIVASAREDRGVGWMPGYGVYGAW